MATMDEYELAAQRIREEIVERITAFASLIDVSPDDAIIPEIAELEAMLVSKLGWPEDYDDEYRRTHSVSCPKCSGRGIIFLDATRQSD